MACGYVDDIEPLTIFWNEYQVTTSSAAKVPAINDESEGGGREGEEEEEKEGGIVDHIWFEGCPFLFCFGCLCVVFCEVIPVYCSQDDLRSRYCYSQVYEALGYRMQAQVDVQLQITYN